MPARRSKHRSRVRHRLALFLTGTGLLLTFYVSCQYWQMYASQRALTIAWQQQDTRPENTVGSDGDGLVRLTIKKINLDAVVVTGTSRESLKLGPGRMKDSALPGSSGNSVIVAHRTLSSVTWMSCSPGMKFTFGGAEKCTDLK